MMRLRKIPAATSSAPPVDLRRCSAAAATPSAGPLTNFSLAADQPAGVNRGTGLELLDQKITMAREEWQVIEAPLLTGARGHQRRADRREIGHRSGLTATRGRADAPLEALHAMADLHARTLDHFFRDQRRAAETQRDGIDARLHRLAQLLERVAD